MICPSNFYVGECVICVKSHTSPRLSLMGAWGSPVAARGISSAPKAGNCLLTYWYQFFFCARSLNLPFKNRINKSSRDTLQAVAQFSVPCGWFPAESSCGQAPGYCWKEVDQNSGVLVNKCLILLTLFWFTHSAMRGCWRRYPAS